MSTVRLRLSCELAQNTTFVSIVQKNKHCITPKISSQQVVSLSSVFCFD
ncbi:hypothetical protein T11_13718 [Trichinella zimbabwensis]|uniref:Uncharacterized protein n=1 Tax=Trichinella zimbabwensis TaxID=268475 RepID=A0A0V1GK45_9BILA|nr:hypothetical protein T11_13718 [Trichinella zimbabwensis]